jgi:ribosomal protein S6--L-glutamate ligase
VTNLAVIGSGSGWHIGDLLRAAESLHVRIALIAFPEIQARCGDSSRTSLCAANRNDLLLADGALIRMMPPGSLEQVVFRMDAIQRLAAAGVPVLNHPRAIEVAVDKYLALARLELAGIPVPRTWVGQSVEHALEAFEQLNRDIVLKPIFGAEGRGMIRITDPSVAARAFRAIERTGHVLYLQEFIPHDGSDRRILLLGDRMLGAIHRASSSAAEWRTNIALGGKATPYRPEKHIIDLALRSARAIGADFAGIDLVLDPDRGWLVLEVNAVPGWKALSRVNKVDVAREVLIYLKTHERRT